MGYQFICPECGEIIIWLAVDPRDLPPEIIPGVYICEACFNDIID